MAFDATIVITFFFLLLLIRELPPIYNPFELPNNTFCHKAWKQPSLTKFMKFPKPKREQK
jgi:hypothetical protein